MVFRSTGCLALLPLLALIGGCQVGKITAPGFVAGDGGGPPPETPQALFEVTVEPLLVARCETCHSNEARAPLFLGPGAYYDSVLAFSGLVIPGQPGTSRLVTYGEHDGPEWERDERAAIEAWIEAEGETGPVEPPEPGDVESVQVAVNVAGANNIPLDSLGLPGSSIQFQGAVIGAGLRMTDVELVGGTGGAALSGPQFILHAPDGTAIPDANDFSGSELRANAGQRAELISSVVLTGWVDDAMLSIRFSSAGQLD